MYFALRVPAPLLSALCIGGGWQCNALNGLLSFLLALAEVTNPQLIVCQRPKRALFISTLINIIMCVFCTEMCQRPKRALFISTSLKKKGGNFNVTIGVNALNGLFSFLQKVSVTFEPNSTSQCQRPKRALFISTKAGIWFQQFQSKSVNALNGLFSFLPPNTQKYVYNVVKLCQRPKRALFISTTFEREKQLTEFARCQRPKRALFISTILHKLN